MNDTHINEGCMRCPLECGADRTNELGACGVGCYDRAGAALECDGIDTGAGANAALNAVLNNVSDAVPDIVSGTVSDKVSGKVSGEKREAGELAYVVRAARHYYEEPPVSGENGSGAIFFSGCNMACIFCQNMDISREQKGIPRDANGLKDIMLRLQELGSHNINLVTPAPHVRLLEIAIPLARREGLTIPIVYNTNAYEKVDTLRRLEGLIDIYLPDLKYRSSIAAQRYSGRANYFDIASKAVLEMQRQCGVLETDEQGIARKGLIIRHLVLPGSVDETRGVLDFIKAELPINTCISIMRQYTPMFELAPPLNRRITKREYERAVGYALSLGFLNIFTQKAEAASSEYTPEFNNYFE